MDVPATCPDCGIFICHDEVLDGREISKPYITDSEDVFCVKCGPKHDEYPDKSVGLDHLEWCRNWLVEQQMSEEWEAIIPASDKQLFIDLDTAEQHQQFLSMWPLISAQQPKWSYRLTFSKSGRVHIIVQMDYYRNLPHRISLQSVLGSDPKREMLHIASYEKGDPNPVVLIERIVRPALPAGEMSTV